MFYVKVMLIVLLRQINPSLIRDQTLQHWEQLVAAPALPFCLRSTLLCYHHYLWNCFNEGQGMRRGWCCHHLTI